MSARNSSGRWWFGWLIVCAALAGFAGCGGPLRFTPKGTPKAPDADAEIVAKVDAKASVTHLDIKAEHLAPPDRVKDGSTSYVVWARKDGSSPWARVGALTYSTEDRKGELKEASVPLTSFDLIISAEQQPDPASPSQELVFTQRVDD